MSNTMNLKYNNLGLQSQHPNQPNFKPWNLIDPQPTCLSPLGAVNGLLESHAKVLNYIIERQIKHKEVYSKIDTIANDLKLGRSTVIRAINKLVRLGFIAKKSNGYNKSCWYKPSSWFKNGDVQKALSRKLFVFAITSFQLLSAFSASGTRSTNDFNFIKKLVVSNYKKSNSLKEEENNQRRILKKKGSMLTPQVEVNEALKKLRIKLNIEQQQALSRFDTELLGKAIDKFNKKPPHKQQFPLLLWLLNNPTVVAESESSPLFFKKNLTERNTQSQPIKITTEPESPPVPWTSISYEQNLIQFGQWYEKHGEEYAQFFKKSLKDIREKFLSQLNDRFKDTATIERVRKNSLEYHQPLQKYKPQSNTINDIAFQHPNTHKQENLPTNSNLVEISKPNLDYDLFEEVLD